MSPDASLRKSSSSPRPGPRVGPPRPHWVRRAPGRLLLSVILGLAGYFIARVRVDWHIRAVIGWDIGALTLTLLTWRVIVRSDAKATAEHAAPDDPGGKMVWVVALFASMFSLFAAAFVLREVHDLPRPASTYGRVWDFWRWGCRGS